MEKYLYGAVVQGIQNFIFQTNELKDIVGASELVEDICTNLFQEAVGKKKWNEENRLITAAGNVKYIFNSKEECIEVVRNFPRKAMINAPGITISQAVVAIKDGDKGDLVDAINELEAKLRVQRNKPNKSLLIGRLGLKRSTKTGFPITRKKGEELLDESTFAKRESNNTIQLCKKSFGESAPSNLISFIPFDVSKMTDKNEWIAIIHADGNGLGQVVQKIAKKVDDFKEFSHKLDKATINSANSAFKKVSPKDGWKGVIPIRPIVLGGDDMTVIIRGDLAFQYVTEFMAQFEKETMNDEFKNILQQAELDKLTVCAGVAFIKSSYPFYYGYELAEQLCKKAKDVAKEQNEKLAPSCLMFHKVQDSFIMRYDEIVKRELQIVYEKDKNDDKQTKENDKDIKKNVSFCFGPYFLDKKQTPENYYTINDLERISEELDKESADGIKTGVRQWLTLMHENNEKAMQRLKRMKTLNETQRELIDDLTKSRDLDEKWNVYPAYDVLAFHTIMNQKTKKEKENDGHKI